MQESGSAESGFNLIEIDLESGQYRVLLYEWQEDYYAIANQRDWQPFQRNKKARDRAFELTDKFANNLTDCGVMLSHPRKSHLTLQDIFVYPDFEDRSFQRKRAGGAITKSINGEQIHVFIQEHRRVLISGGEKGGKTALAKMLYLHAMTEQKTPLLISGDQLSKPDEAAINLVLDRCVAEQYGVNMVERYRQLDKSSKMLIIDDLQRSKLNQRGLAALVEAVDAKFGGVVIFANDFFSPAMRYQTIWAPTATKNY